MSEENTEITNEPVAPVETPANTETTTEAPVTESQEAPRTFTQDQVDEIIAKRISKERSKYETTWQQYQDELKRLSGYQANFEQGTLQPQQQMQQEPEFDPNRPLTLSDLQAMVEQQKLQEEAARYDAMAKETMQKYEDFKQVSEANRDLFLAFANDPGLSAVAENTQQPFEFIYQVAKSFQNEAKEILKQSNPYLKAAALDKLADKIKARNAVPDVSQAPRPLSEERGDAVNYAGMSVDAKREAMRKRG